MIEVQTADDILAQRARELAQADSAAEIRATLIEVMTFTVGPELYAIETHYVREIVRLAELTPIPGVPPFFAGVMNLRGAIVAIADLEVLLDIDSVGVRDKDQVVVVGVDRAEFGILTDHASDVLTVDTSAFLDATGVVGPEAANLLAAVTEAGLVVLDGYQLLADPRLFVDAAPAPALSAIPRG